MANAMSEEEMIHEFDNMVRRESEADEPTTLFEGWSDNDKIIFMKQLQVDLSEQSEATDLDEMNVPPSVMFDITDDEKAQNNYISSIGHYRSWQYSGSDKRYQFGSKSKRTFVTRPSGVFVFYFRYKHLVVGLIVDGQSGWVEGAITNNLDDGRESVLQFERGPVDLDYIRSSRTYNLKYDGNYTKAGKTYEAKLGIWHVRKAIVEIASFVPQVTGCEPEPIYWQILILFSVEAGRLNHVFCHTSPSLSIAIGPNGTLKLPISGEQFILNYLKLSLGSLQRIEGRSFIHVKGTTPRNLYQVLLEILILRREVIFPTFFILSDAPPMEFKKNEPRRGKGSRLLIEEHKWESENAKGHRYIVGKHDGTSVYRCEDWLLHPFKEAVRTIQHGPANGIPDVSESKITLVTEILTSDALTVMPKILQSEMLNGLQKLDLTEGEIAAQQLIGSSTYLKRSIQEKWYWEGQHQKRGDSATGGCCLSMLKYGITTTRTHALAQEELWHDEPGRRLHMALEADNCQVPKIMKRHIARVTDNMLAQNKKAKLMASEHEETCHASTQRKLSDKLSGSHAILAEDDESRTVPMTNVHLMATEEAALSTHFMSGTGTGLKISLLRDAVASHSKGAASVTFDDIECTEKAVSLTRISTFSRFAKVRCNAEKLAPGFLAACNLYCPCPIPSPLPGLPSN
uniref:rRNA N-glycosidase n=1 Tax=Hordeum vulgare subsp. vulgare TaxID=112509 RepID=A0A8I6WYT1_HORVV